MFFIGAAHHFDDRTKPNQSLLTNLLNWEPKYLLLSV